MSAINPASFASPSLGLQAPSGVGPGAVGVGAVNRGSDRARGQQQEVFTPTRGGNGGYGQERGAVSPMSYQQTPQSGMSYGYGAFNSPSSFASSPPMSSASFGRNSGGYGGGMPQIDPFVAFAPEYGMGMMGGSYMHPGQEQEGEYRQGGSPGQPAWIGSFQSLSLGSR